MKSIRTGPPRDPATAYVYQLRKKQGKVFELDRPDWVDVGKAFEAGRRYERRKKK